ncbi:MAG: DUF835 domain-containing protein [Euryarchaeota archaeon]|nr:DUF835 domain-containing protein [Euryarchaeota archaeon]MDE1835074.1 DUF835 domain-containing protein [Euryarchaeota archaeon]MDE1879345.1 DUF835 domain-containing protein [Euryarchaeota archaeon]MDE2044964.1 DUF835 domain-containing protein [Thermoplasmata archaeon]
MDGERGGTAHLIGREEELGRLRNGLERADHGQGGAWLLLGPGGIGKTQVLRWLEEEARARGFEVRWGYALKDEISPFFAFQQAFRRPANEEWDAFASPEGGSAPLPEALAPLVILEEGADRRWPSMLTTLARSRPLLLFTRRQAPRPFLPGGTQGVGAVILSRVEGVDHLPPTSLDLIAERAEEHLLRHPGGAVAFENLEFLCSQNPVRSVLQLLQYVRDTALAHRGTVLVSLRPGAFHPRDLALLETDAQVLRAPPPNVPGSSSRTAGQVSTPAVTMLGYLSILEEAGRRAAQLLIVDDLHWADALSGLAFQFLGRNTSDLRLMLVGAAREEDLPVGSDDGGPSLISRFDALEREGRLQRVALRPFGPSEVRELSRQLIGSSPAPPSDEAVAALLKRTEGNPYFLREILLQWQEEGQLHRLGPTEVPELTGETGRVAAANAVPPSIRRFVLHRLSRLSKEQRAWLDAAAVAGSEFEVAPLPAALGLSLERTLAIAEELSFQYRLIEPATGTAEEGWSFAHPMVWEAVIETLVPSHRRAYALSLLGWWEIHRSGDLGALARLGHDTGEVPRALPWVRKALKDAAERLAPEATLTYLAWEHELTRSAGRRPMPSELEDETEDIGRASNAGGGRSAMNALRGLLAEELGPSLRWRVRTQLAMGLARLDRREHVAMLETLQQEIERGGDDVPGFARHRVQIMRADLAFDLQKFEEASALYRLAVEAPPSDLPPLLRVGAFRNLIMCEQALGRGDHVPGWLSRAEPYVRDDPRAASPLRNAEAYCRFVAGDMQAAVRLSLEAAKIEREQGFLSAAVTDEYNAANILMDLDEREEAERLAKGIFEVGRKFDIARTRYLGALLLAQLSSRAGDHSAALRWAARARAEAAETQITGDVREGRIVEAVVIGRSGDLPRAISAFDELDREGAFTGAPQAESSLPDLCDFLERNGDLPRALEIARRVQAAAEALHNAPSSQKARMRVDRLVEQIGTPGPPS